ncbi:alpha-N-acetylgalactosaminidase-like isoform X1 [Lingula anatina]|uniref:Alpha-galactosidase n=1 Tax=Lingula anatina TaxID=7574 RepID=A0A1S3K261_LINAN|nr:alpha-N-acetylgalactosaminidase-like isoform X1 [Lingula anatina]|eukprot:XP_013416361.1 alpha-N-acetylgalactosaminidase-like isoform X1 [Lingula anatina]
MHLYAATFLWISCLLPSQVDLLNNGLARTPPMGWLAWERFRCDIDCKDDPDNCISEKLFRTMGDLLVKEGYKDVGYEYVNIDDCWLTHSRNAKNQLEADPTRFPSGIKNLSSYIHNLGLKLGIYEDFGTKTCAGYPGILFQMDTDAQTFADWGVDMLKLDGCNVPTELMPYGYPEMGRALNRTNRPIMYSCSWPAYLAGGPKLPDYQAIAQSCNLWRNYDDIQDSWDSLKGIIDFYGDDKGNFSMFAGPGAWNDPDMLIIGNYGLSYDQQRVQMAMWAIMASPLLMGNDLRHIAPESKAILQNKNVIAINQDPMGKMGKRVIKNNDIQVWTRPVMPTGSYAFTIVNYGVYGTPAKLNYKLSDMGISGSKSYLITEVFDGSKIGVHTTSDVVTYSVNPTGVFMGKAVPQ